MTKSLEESIVIQAMRDLLDANDNERAGALEFFLADGHDHLCDITGLNAKAIKKRVIEAAQHHGVRREKLVKDLIRELPRN